MIHYRASDYPQPHMPTQHQWLAERWDHQHRIPDSAEHQAYDSDRQVLMFVVDGEQKEIAVQTPPLWIGKDVGQWSRD